MSCFHSIISDTSDTDRRMPPIIFDESGLSLESLIKDSRHPEDTLTTIAVTRGGQSTTEPFKPAENRDIRPRDRTGSFPEQAVKEDLPRVILEALKEESVRRYLHNRLKISGLKGDWKINDNKLVVCGSSKLDAERCIDMLTELIYYQSIGLRAEYGLLVETDKWTDMSADIRRQYKDKVRGSTIVNANL